MCIMTKAWTRAVPSLTRHCCRLLHFLRSHLDGGKLITVSIKALSQICFDQSIFKLVLSEKFVQCTAQEMFYVTFPATKVQNFMIETRLVQTDFVDHLPWSYVGGLQGKAWLSNALYRYPQEPDRDGYLKKQKKTFRCTTPRQPSMYF